MNDALACEIHCLTPEQARMAWPQVKPMLEKGLRRTKVDLFMSIDDVLFHIASGKYHLWVAHRGMDIDAAGVGQICQYDRCKTYSLFLGGGSNIKAWVHEFVGKVEETAKKLGCDFCEGGGRRGWIKAAGWDDIGVRLLKDLR